jgi:hypothetical protein
MESYWCETDVIKAHFGVEDAVAEDILNQATAKACEQNNAQEKRRQKRNDVMTKIPEARKGLLPQFGDQEVETAAIEHGQQHKVLGRDLVSSIRGNVQDQKLPLAGSFGKTVPSGLNEVLADELRATREALLYLTPQLAKVDLSRNCAAPLIAYYALKENIYGNEANDRIQTGSCACCADEWAEPQTSSIGLQNWFFDTVSLDQRRARQYYAH